MKIAMQTGGADERCGIDGAYRLIAECGFDAADANIDYLVRGADIKEKKIPRTLVCGDEKDVRELVRPWKDAAIKYQLENYQAHAPFPSYVFDDHDESYNDVILKMLDNCIIAADEIGCRNLIIHPFFADYKHRFTPEKEWEININRYCRLIPTAKKYGVTICLENMFVRNNGKIYSACCSDIHTACAYVDELNRIARTRAFGFCFDTGHALLCSIDVRDAMVELGDRICAFHVHDNNGIDDQHLAPYMGILDWERFVQGLKEIPFSGTMSFETLKIWRTVDAEVVPELMRYIAVCGRMFATRAGK